MPLPFFILFYVDWENQVDYGIHINKKQGLWGTTLREINDLVLDGKIKWHRYQNRKHDRNGNARAAMIISLSDLCEIEHV